MYTIQHRGKSFPPLCLYLYFPVIESLPPAKQPPILNNHRQSKNANNNNNAPPDELDYLTTHDNVDSNSHPCNDSPKFYRHNQNPCLHLGYTNSTSIKARAEFRSISSLTSLEKIIKRTILPHWMHSFCSHHAQSTPWRLSPRPRDLLLASCPLFFQWIPSYKASPANRKPLCILLNSTSDLLRKLFRRVRIPLISSLYIEIALDSRRVLVERW